MCFIELPCIGKMYIHSTLAYESETATYRKERKKQCRIMYLYKLYKENTNRQPKWYTCSVYMLKIVLQAML